MAGYSNYNLGKGGVNVDASPIHADPTELLKAQNAIRNPLGADGGLTNRPGLVKFNGSGLGGSILGGLATPMFSFIDTRTLYLAQFNGGVASWVSTSNLFTASVVTTALATWKDPTAYYSLGAGVCRMGVFYNGQVYYAASGYTVGTTSPTIRVFNGSDDRELCKILPATTKGITGFWVSQGQMYVLTLDSGTSDADWVSSVYHLETNGHLTKMGDALATGYVATALISYNDKLYVGGSRLTTTNEAKVFSLDPLSSTTTWATDLTADADDYQITGFASFGGLIYTTTKNGGGATKGKVKSRSLAGTWSTVDSTVNNSGTYEDIKPFAGKLYVTSRSYDAAANTAVIRRSSDGASWATVSNNASGAGYGILTLLGLRLFSMATSKVLHSLDGSAWTSATPAGSGDVDGVLGTLLVTGAPAWAEPVASTAQPTVNVTNIAAAVSAFDPFLVKRFYWYMVQAATADQLGWSFSGSITNDGNVLTTDSVYGRLQSSGGVNSTMGLIQSATEGSVRLSFASSTTPIVLKAMVRTYSSDQSQYRIRVGFLNSSSFVNSNTAGVLSICFRYLHGVGSSADNANWFLELSDGTTQTDTDTGMPVLGGTAAGSNKYNLTLTITSSAGGTWAIENVTAGTSASGSFTLPGTPSTTTRMFVHNGGHDIPGAVKVWLISKMYLETP